MIAALLLLAPVPPAPEPPRPPAGVEAALAAAPRGTRVGLVVADEDGRELVAIRPDERFVPASNTKLFTTAAAFALLEAGAPDGGGGAAVRLEEGDAVLSGNGDARLSSAADCATDCLADLARAVAARTRAVRDVVGDDAALPDERWPAGMSWNNQVTRYGTAVSALTLDDNTVALTVRPGRAGEPPVIMGDGYYRVANRSVTSVAGPATLSVTRVPGSLDVRVDGALPAGAEATLTLGVDDPAHRAAWRFAAMLRAAGVRVSGQIRVRHRPLSPADDPARRGAAPPARPPAPAALARLAPPPLADDVALTNKQSQNLHAELLLRRVGTVRGSGSVADGRAAVAGLMDSAGVPRWAYEFADGSGMSNYNRLTPRAAVTFLRWAARRSWGAAWRATLPVGGRDGTLARRFGATALEDRIFAKTGSLSGASALSGYLVAASGRTLSFSALANDVPGDASATPALDAALLAVAAAY